MSMMMLTISLSSAYASPSRDVLWERFEAHFDDDGIPLAGAGHESGCLTGVLRELRENLDLLEGWQRDQALLALEPWRRNLAPGEVPPPESCFGRVGENYVEGEHFSVEWDGNTISRATAEDFLEALELSWGVEVDELGWYAPSGANQTPILAYVSSGNYAGAYTTVDGCSQGGVSGMPYIVAYSGSFYAGNWYKTMAAHEFHHATQFYYGYGHEFYWWEASATWMEEYVYPTLNDWASPIYTGYSQQPHIAMNASDQNDDSVFWHMYAMAIWAFYLDEKVGGHDLVQQIWELGWNYNSTYYGLWMPDLIEEAGYSFDELYPEFMATVAVADFADTVHFTQPVMRATIDELPSSGDAPSSDAPQSLGQNFIKFDADLGEDGKALEVSFDGQDGVEWYAVLVRGQENVLSDYISIELDGDGVGTGQINFPAGSEDIYLVVSPKDDNAVGSDYDWARAEDFEYEWTAAFVEAEPEEETPGDGSGNGGESGNAACGCSAGGGALSLSWIVGLLAFVRRRR
ncbi:MAG: hypothetical protein P8R54_19995 [Myxococcota bacterium]|nr:hypothetical protein [Myxococcota bacterium]